MPIGELVQEFRRFYAQRFDDGLTVEIKVPLLDNPHLATDAQIKQLIIKNPLERFIIQGFLEYSDEDSVVRFAPQLWSELRYYELLDIQQNVEEQLRYYYSRK